MISGYRKLDSFTGKRSTCYNTNNPYSVENGYYDERPHVDDSYDGDFVDGRATGFGRHSIGHWSGVDLYDGQLFDGYWHGKGSFYTGNSSNRKVISGEWCKGEPCIDGFWKCGYRDDPLEDSWEKPVKRSFKDGSSYVGGFIKDSDWVSKDSVTKYIGQGFNGIISGEGRYTFANGEIYEGQFDKNQISGIGRLTHVSGEITEGLFRDGKFVGK